MTDDEFNLNMTQTTYLNQFIALTSSKLDSKNYSKIIWKKYYDQKIDLSEARRTVCKINSKQLTNQAYISKIYVKFGIASTGIDLYVDCMKIVDNKNYSDEKKTQEITKKVIGAGTSTAVGLKCAKYIGKFITALRKTTPLPIIGGFFLDCVLSYYLGKTTDDITEELIQKAFDCFNK